MIRFPSSSPFSKRFARRSRAVWVAAAVSCIACGSAQAQNPSVAGIATGEAQSAPQAPADRTFSPLTSVQISTLSDSSNATLKLTSGGNRWSKRETSDPHTAVADVLTLAVSSPVAKGGAPTSLGTLDGLASGATVQLQYSQYRVGGFKWAMPDKARIDEICANAKTSYRKKYGQAYTEACSTGFVRSNDSADADEYRGVFFTDKKPRALMAFGVSGKVGYETHTYYDAATLDKSSSNTSPVSAGAYYTLISPRRRWAVTGEAQYQRIYKDATAQIVCPSPGTTPTTKCINGSIGGPTTTTKQLLSAELRGTLLDGLSIFGITSLAFDPLVTYDIRSQAYGFDVPVYVFGGSAGLTGGVRADWDSDKRSWACGIFISKAFSVFDHQ